VCLSKVSLGFLTLRAFGSAELSLPVAITETVAAAFPVPAPQPVNSLSSGKGTSSVHSARVGEERAVRYLVFFIAN
jgi:hypothetical protein